MSRPRGSRTAPSSSRTRPPPSLDAALARRSLTGRRRPRAMPRAGGIERSWARCDVDPVACHQSVARGAHIDAGDVRRRVMSHHYDEGRKAYTEGKARHDNPYDINSEDWARWMDGFDQAATEAEYGYAGRRARASPSNGRAPVHGARHAHGCEQRGPRPRPTVRPSGGPRSGATGPQLSPRIKAGWKTTLRGAASGPRSIRSTSSRSASLVMSAIGCSVRVRRGRRPTDARMVSVDAIDTSFGHDSPRSASARMTSERHDAVTGDIDRGGTVGARQEFAGHGIGHVPLETRRCGCARARARGRAPPSLQEAVEASPSVVR